MDKHNALTKLALARVEILKRDLKKSGQNKFAGFKYYELADFLPIVNTIFNDLGLLAVFSLGSKKATLKIINTENSEDKITFKTPVAEVSMKGVTDVQALGATHTYLKRYLYLNALELVENDLLDATAGKQATAGSTRAIGDTGTETAKSLLRSARDLEELKASWQKLPAKHKANGEIIEFKNQLKEKLSQKAGGKQ